jgi:hypothetical protein
MCIEHVISLEKEELLEPGIAIDQRPLLVQTLSPTINQNEIAKEPVTV